MTYWNWNLLFQLTGENLVLLKGNYTIEDLTGVKIKRRKYEMIFTID